MTGDGGSIRRSRSPRGRQAAGEDIEAVLPDDEVQRRVDLREIPPDVAPETPWIGEDTIVTPTSRPPAELAGAVPALEVVRRSRASADERRRQLWRDSATILIGVVLALLVGQALLPAQTAGPGPSDTPLPSTVAIGSSAPVLSLPPGVTFGPIIDPSLGVDASPTPIPVITMGPTPSPSPSPSPSIEPTPEATGVPPVAKFTATVSGLKLTVTNTSTGVVRGETTWLWTFGDGTKATVRNPGSHTYQAGGTYTVKLTMTTPAGTDSFSRSYTVVAPTQTSNPTSEPTLEPTPVPTPDQTDLASASP